MKLLRLKINDPDGFRSLPCGFEHYFRPESALQDELDKPSIFAPFVCAGPNGSGKSNLLEVLAAIFYQLEVQRVQRNFLPKVFEYDPVENPTGIKDSDGTPNAYELEYLIKIRKELRTSNSGSAFAHVRVIKEIDKSPSLLLSVNENTDYDFELPTQDYGVMGFVLPQYAFDNNDEDFKFRTPNDEERDFLLPQYVLAYSSGENEILSLPFFKMRFIQFDEYWNALSQQYSYPGRPDTRLVYLDNAFSQAILLCNLLFQDEHILQPFREDVGIEEIKEFRIIIKRSIILQPEQLIAFANEDKNKRQSLEDIVLSNSALSIEKDDQDMSYYRLDLLQLLEEKSEGSFLTVNTLQRCATLSFVDESTDTLFLDYKVDNATKEAFHKNFDGSPLVLFQFLQVLLTLNLYSVSDTLKTDLYQSSSHYISETVPTLASDERIMRFKNFYLTKQGITKPMLLKELSDGEYQLLHSLGLCLLFRDTNSLFLLDEPETHFNPDWRANFISRLRECLPSEGDVGQEMLITTHSPFLISDSTPEKVLIFTKDEANSEVSISHPDYNTLGASINKITMNTFGKRETIGGHAQALLEGFRLRYKEGNEDKERLITEIHHTLGDSVEKLFLIKMILDDTKQVDEGVHD